MHLNNEPTNVTESSKFMTECIYLFQEVQINSVSTLPYSKESEELVYKAFVMFTNNHGQWCQTACPIRMLIPETMLPSAFRGEAFLYSEQLANADTIGYSMDWEKSMPKKGYPRQRGRKNTSACKVGDGCKILPSEHEVAQQRKQSGYGFLHRHGPCWPVGRVKWPAVRRGGTLTIFTDQQTPPHDMLHLDSAAFIRNTSQFLSTFSLWSNKLANNCQCKNGIFEYGRYF